MKCQRYTRKTKVLYLFLIFGILSFGAIVLVPVSFLATTIQPSLLSLVVSKEIEIAKQWQEKGAFTRNIQMQNTGFDVRLLQQYLAWHTDLLAPQYATGYFGSLTKNALQQYQFQNGLPPSGVLDEVTRDYLNKELLHTLCPVSTAEFLSLETSITRKTGIPVEYVPPRLVELTAVPTNGRLCLVEEVMIAYQALYGAAKKAGYDLKVTSGFRRPEIQQMLVDFWVALEGVGAYSEIALPGHSEHQLGTTLDLTGKSIGYTSVSDQFANSPEFVWLQQNASQFGFVLSYPKLTENQEYNFEPWHWRYIGVNSKK